MHFQKIHPKNSEWSSLFDALQLSPALPGVRDQLIPESRTTLSRSQDSSGPRVKDQLVHESGTSFSSSLEPVVHRVWDQLVHDSETFGPQVKD